MRRTKEDAEKTKAAIIEAAIDAFASQSFSAATLNSIAKEAGVTRGAVYWHFENKAQIFNEVNEQLHQDFVNQLQDCLAENPAEPVKQLEELFVFLVEDMERDLRKQKVIALVLGEIERSGLLQEFETEYLKQKKQSEALLSQFFELAQAKGQLDKNLCPNTLAVSLLCFVRGIIFEYFNREPDSRAGLMARLLRLYFNPPYAR